MQRAKIVATDGDAESSRFDVRRVIDCLTSIPSRYYRVVLCNRVERWTRENLEKSVGVGEEQSRLEH